MDPEKKANVDTETGAANETKNRNHKSGKIRSWTDRLYPRQSLIDVRNPLFWKDIVIEGIVCAYVVCLVLFVMVTCNKEHYRPNTTHFGLFAAFLIFVMIEAWGPLCGCLINPAAAFGFFVAGRTSLARCIMFMAAETVGAAIGAMIGFSLTPVAEQETLMPIMPSPGLSNGQAMVIEAIVTFNLIMVALGVTTPGKHSTLAALAIGCCKASGILAAGTHTGGLQNPIVPFGPAVATKNFTRHFVVYWIGPYIGALVAAILYRVIVAVTVRCSKSSASQELTTGVEDDNAELNLIQDQQSAGPARKRNIPANNGD